MDSTAKKSRGSGPNDEVVSGEAVTFNVNKLSRELLIRVFGWLPFHQRHETIPLVCRKWAELTSVPCKSKTWCTVSAASRYVQCQAGKLFNRILCGLQALFGSTLV